MTAATGPAGAGAASGDPVELARALVRIPSVNPVLEEGGAGEEEAARAIAAWLEAWGFDVRTDEIASGRFNVVGRSTGMAGGPTLVFNGHLDTVGVEGMTVPPFDAEVRDGRLIGRGAADMKGGLAALLSAARALAASGHPGTLVVALTADEEHASLGMEALVAGGVRADGAVVCEPTSLAVMPAHKGFVWVRALFRGRAAHGSRPDLGVDAVRHAGLYLAALEELHAELGRRPAHALLGRPSFHAGTIRGGSASSVYPERCELVLERRTLPGEDGSVVEEDFARVLAAVAAREGSVDAVLERTLERSGTEVPGTSPLVLGLLDAIEGEGVPARVEGMSAWVDAALLNEAGVPAVCFGPGSIARAHVADEWAPVDEIARAARILERFARAFLGGAAGPSGASARGAPE